MTVGGYHSQQLVRGETRDFNPPQVWKMCHTFAQAILYDPADFALFTLHFERLCGSERVVSRHEEEEPVQVVHNVRIIRRLREGKLVMLDRHITKLGRVKDLPQFDGETVGGIMVARKPVSAETGLEDQEAETGWHLVLDVVAEGGQNWRTLHPAG